ncbi:MAG: RluA family pseudouridine synthase [Blastocatellia bacterium]
MREQQPISAVRSFQASDADAGQRLDEFLAARVGDLSRMRIANLIASGESTVNGEVARAGLRVAAGDSIALAVEAGAPNSMSPDEIPLEILFEDEHLIVLVKPAGMLVHPTLSVKRGTLANALAHHLNKGPGFRVPGSGGEDAEPPETKTRNSEPVATARMETRALVRPGMVHRLDRATSGVMVVAKTQRALSVLSRHFHKRLVEKRYLALVHGNISEDDGTIIAPIGRDEDRRPRWWVMESGKHAETRFCVRERLGGATLVELEPVTGRTNQLRIHCAYYGYPIVGDEPYEAVVSGQWSVVSEEPRVHDVPTISGEATDHWPLTTDHCSSPPTGHRPPRMCLHAYSLAFHHPADGQWLEFTSPLPADFISCLETMRSESQPASKNTKVVLPFL